ncbi:MAG: hypothetical protein JXR41_11700 [Bacteroidales bacterium]|nr:hypothetical protein [Bacteroidales bacterium]
MSTNFAIAFCNTYIHVKLDPDFVISTESMNKLWLRLAEASSLYNCQHIFAEGLMPSRRMDMAGAFVSGDKLAQSIAGLYMACFFEGYETDELTEFFKTVARNRGAMVEFFNTREEAFRWLGINLPQENHPGEPNNNHVTYFLM